MPSFREQLFLQFACQGISGSIDSFQSKYQPKKENRFNFDEITYETSPAKLSEGCLEFEISSKIPQDELLDRNDFESYFSAIKNVLAPDEKQPIATDMENIVHEVAGDEEVKERDYVRLRYRYSFDEVCSNDVIAEEITKYQEDPGARELPEIANVNTLAGRLVLLLIEDFFQNEATARMDRLIEANQHVRQSFKQQMQAASTS
ncbi:MAG: hypothetical protein ETSY1_17240 [Candidatus Entotheonella factor]|uniref:Uncharacterized protein n=1 Tax=Entotheonella factor TaxID=1429438 RepID=W4LMD6_ENTF1|nr:MAG: hypothetical protein ETSY1_17240 [Candidatus Entotheonella factor]